MRQDSGTIKPAQRWREGESVYIDLHFIIVVFLDYQVITIALTLQKQRISLKRKLAAVMSAAFLDSIFMVIKMKMPIDIGLKAIQISAAVGMAFFIAVILLPKEKFAQRIKMTGSLLISVWILSGGLQWFLYQGVSALRFCITASVFTFFFCCLFALYQKKISLENMIVKVTIIIQDEEYQLLGLWDTGNHLYEPYRHRPVHIIEADILSAKSLKQPYLYVPYQSLGKKEGILPVFCAKTLMIEKENQQIVLENQMIGLTQLSLSSRGHYQMLLHPDAMIYQREGKIIC